MNATTPKDEPTQPTMKVSEQPGKPVKVGPGEEVVVRRTAVERDENTVPRPNPATTPLTHDEDSKEAVTRVTFYKLNAEIRNTSDLFLNSNNAAWSGQIPLGDVGYAEAIKRAIDNVNNEFDDRARAQGKRPPAPAEPKGPSESRPASDAAHRAAHSEDRFSTKK